jgi:hypothetical protein
MLRSWVNTPRVAWCVENKNIFFYSEKMLLAYYSPGVVIVKDMHQFWQKMGWATFWAIFRKLVWSPCFVVHMSFLWLSEEPITSVTQHLASSACQFFKNFSQHRMGANVKKVHTYIDSAAKPIIDGAVVLLSKETRHHVWINWSKPRPWFLTGKRTGFVSGITRWSTYTEVADIYLEATNVSDSSSHLPKLFGF